MDGQGSRSPADAHVDSFTAKAHGHVPDGAFVVPDPNLIFNGEFKRTGLDLLLSHEGHEFVVHDYFRGDKRAALASPDGAHLTGDVVNALTGYVQIAQAAPGATAAQVIGHVTKLVGSATAVRNGVSVILNNGDNVEKGDVVSTGADSTLGITFIDGTVFGLSSNARMVLNEMVYDPNGSSNSSLLSLVAGTITFVAGETAKHGDMKIDTPVATMGIRGTAVLTQINFVVPAGGGDPQPQASFQVLVEPNGTTGSYILFDKVTLLPIATVNQAGQMIQISGGNVSISNALMSPDVQKLITDVFTLKFTDNNTNTKLTTNFTDTLTPISQDLAFKSGSGPVVIATFVNLNPQGSEGPSTSTPPIVRIPGQPIAQSFDASGKEKTAFSLTERADTTGDTHTDTISGLIRFVDQNLGDRPTVSISLADAPNYVYKDTGQHDVTGSLSALQKQDIAATQIQIGVVADAGNDNNGSAAWTYTIPDNVFDFLAAGETLTLTYMVRVDTNFTVSPESKFIPITITITGANDKPTVTTLGGTVIEKIGTGNEALDTISGAVTFTDVDLTDRPIVSAALSSTQQFKYLDAEGNDITATLTPEQRAAIAAVEVPLTVVQGAGNGNNGSATWTYSAPDHLFDFLAEGETLTLNYVVQVDDGHGGVVSTPIAVSINGADVNVEGTNDVPTIVDDSTTPAGAVTEDTATTLAANGTITFNDPDLTDTHTASYGLKSTISSAHLPGFSDGTSHIGTFALAPVNESPGASSRGSVGWTFTLNDNDPVLQSLAQGQTITQVYTVTVDDHHGGTVTQDVTVTITGTNDAPTITSDADAAMGRVTEDTGATLSAGGTLAIQDLDLIDTHTAQAVFKSSTSSAHLPGFVDGTSNIGTFTIDPSLAESGSDTENGATLGWHFTLDNSDPVLQSLAEGQTITQVYTVTFDDHHGGTVSQDVTVAITGTNDAPAVSCVTSDYMNFDGQTIAVGDVPTVAADGVTLDGWVNWNGDAAPDGQVLFYNGNTSTSGFGLIGTVVSGKLEIEILEGGVEIQDTGFALTAGQWHNLALTRDQGTLTLYVDGNAVYSHNGDVNAIGSDQDPAYLMIGAASDRYVPGFGAQGFFGSIANVSVWTTALMQTQIQSIDFTRLAGSETNLAAYYQLGDGSGTTAANTVNSAHSLAIEGTADWASGTSAPGGAVADLMETNAGQISHGVLTVSDIDAIDHVTVSVSQVQVSLDGVLQTGCVGGLSHADLLNYLTVPSGDILDGTASYAQFTWNFNSGSQAFDFLAAGQTLSLQYTIVPSDAEGAGTGAIVTVNIAGSNDAPTLDDATLTSVAGNESDPCGSTIGDLFANKFHDADTGASFKAVAVSADNATSDQGVWQYEIAGTDQWVDISGVSDTSALVLSNDSLIRFVPVQGFCGTPGSLDVHAIDDTYTGAVTACAPVSIDISGAGHGGTTPVSDQAASIGTGVTPPPDSLLAQDDTISNAAPPSADAGWVLDTENGHYYRIVASELTWDQANAHAIGDGGYLATVTSQHESDFIANLPGWGNVRYGVWSGGQSLDDDLQSSSHWTWVTGPEAGSDFTYTAWRAGEPSGWFGDAVGYMVIEDRGADWNDVPPYFANRAYIEEWGGQPGQVAFKENVATTLTTAQLLANDSDSTGNPISVTSVGDPSGHSAHGGTVALDGNIITYKPATDYFGTDSFTYTISAGVETATATVSFNVEQVGGPVIDTESFQVWHSNESNTDLITNLAVLDSDTGAATDTFTFTAVAAHAPGSSVDPTSASGLLSEINLGFENGMTYDPGQAPPDIEQITLTVTDSAGRHDTVQFIFHEAGDTSQGVTLQGTSGKDVIFATDTNDTLTGGGAKDQFVFAPGVLYDENGQPATNFSHTITDFTTGLDKIDLRQFSDVNSISNLTIAQQQDSGDTLITWHQQVTQPEGAPVTENESLLLNNVIAANLKASDFIFHMT